jgi:hypothetical protein
MYLCVKKVSTIKFGKISFVMIVLFCKTACKFEMYWLFKLSHLLWKISINTCIFIQTGFLPFYYVVSIRKKDIREVKNVKIISEEKSICRLHRMTPSKIVLRRVWPVVRGKKVFSAVPLELLQYILHSFGDFLQRRHVVKILHYVLRQVQFWATWRDVCEIITVVLSQPPT